MNQPARKALFAAAILVVLTLLAYLPAIRGGFIWDDDDYVTGSEPLRTIGGLAKIWFQLGATKQYYPAVHTTFWLEYHLWGLNPLGFHLVNVVLHSLNALLLWMLLRQLSMPGAYLAAAIFALHPVHVESVAWITERKNVLSCFFYLSSALAYLRFAPGIGTSEVIAKSRRQSGKLMAEVQAWQFYFPALLLFLFALLSKTVTATLPAAILLVLWWKKGRLVWRDVIPLIPMFALGIALGLLTAWLEKHNVGAVGKEWNFSLIDRFLIAGRAVWFYAGKLLAPINLSFIYPRWKIDDSALWQFLFPLSAAAVILALWLARHRVGRGPLIAVLFFAGTLMPALGFFDVYPMQYSFVADHFQYHASIGPIALFAAVFQRSFARLRGAKSWHFMVAGASLVAILALLSWHQCHIYQNLETLYRDTLSKSPACILAHQNLGTLLMDQGKITEAKEHFSEILRLEPKNADTMANLGLAMYQSGHVVEAIHQYQQALAIQPNQINALNNLAWIRATHPDSSFRDGPEAVRLAEHACAVAKQKSAPYFDTLAAAYAEAGRYDESVQAIGEALTLAKMLDQRSSVQVYQDRLDLYQSHRPLRENPPQ